MQAVIFDLDGTIVLSHKLHFIAYKAMFDELKLSILMTEQEFNDTLVGTGAPTIFRFLLARLGNTKLDPDALVIRKRALFETYLPEYKLAMVPGFAEYLRKLQNDKTPYAIASNAAYNNILSMLKKIGFENTFSVIASGEDVANPKPAPDVFLHAADLLKIPPNECIVIEDRPYGIMATRAAGMEVIGLSTTTSAEVLLKAGAQEVFANYYSVIAKPT